MFLFIALFSITALYLIVVFLIIEGLPIFDFISIKQFLFGHYWYPTDDPADFGIFPLILGSIYVTIVSGLIAIPLGVMTAVYLAEIATPKVKPNWTALSLNFWANKIYIASIIGRSCQLFWKNHPFYNDVIFKVNIVTICI